jgi:hypothetical protein
MRWLERFMVWLIKPIELLRSEIPCKHSEWQAEGSPKMIDHTTGYQIIPECSCHVGDSLFDKAVDRWDKVMQWMFIYIIISFGIVLIQFIILLFANLN